MAQGDRDPLAYGYLPEDEPEVGGERGIVGDAFRRLRGGHSNQQQYNTGSGAYNYSSQTSQGGFAGGPQSQYNQSPYTQSGNQNHNTQPSSAGGISSLFDKVHGVLHGIGSEINQAVSGQVSNQGHTHADAESEDEVHNSSSHRFGSFAAERDGNDVKWYVDGCSYMWAVSRALEQATESIWILDWWLSPELYLRRPPAKHEQYRVDRMLQSAAQRGVKVNIIVYKEVTQALTRKYLSPTLPEYLQSLLPRSTDPITSGLSRLGLAITFKSLELAEAQTPLIAPPITVSSSHTKHALENLHPNIAVFRHPDHLPDAQTLQSSFISSLQNLSLTAATASKLPGDALKALYGANEDVILYWAHHEKLLLVDGRTAFMGGLDLCYGRWDTNQHPIADAHPENLNNIVFPGQDFNNARVMDFQEVNKWQNNKLDRSTSSRMGWSDLSICLSGPVVEDLRAHFVERWNFVYDEKYNVRKDRRYSRLTFTENTSGVLSPQGYGTYGQPQQQSYQPPPYNQQQSYQAQQYHQQPQQTYTNQSYEPNSGSSPYYSSPPRSQRGFNSRDEADEERGFGHERHHHLHGLEHDAKDEIRHIRDQYGRDTQHHGAMHGHQKGVIPCQIMRSCGKWSHGVPTEHSIANAYISVIQKSEHFIYIENQFFITATSDKQKPVKNKIGAAIVERILRAARAGEKYKVIVMMPAVPAFAGDLKDDSSLGTRAIMEFQYNSINRGGYSIMEMISKAGYEPTDYIRFYNLRNYDRINCGAPMRDAEQRSGVSYGEASRQYDDAIGARYDTGGGSASNKYGSNDQYQQYPQYQQYQQGVQQMGDRYGEGKGRWDSVSECYMLGGEDIRNVPWENGNLAEMDAFVSEELYIHSKILIADDRLVLCGSSNLNDRSQLGYHDSEICVLISDPTPLASRMNNQPYSASRFAATLRRQLFRKHLGLLKPQDMERPDANSEPIGVPSDYDFGSREDEAVIDPLSDAFLNLWNVTARRNTDIFGQIFHPVPHDSVRNWKDYDAFYSHFFHPPEAKAANKDAASSGAEKKLPKEPSKYKWGHVVAENFSPGEQGVREVKELLAGVRGTLVEMPLMFLIEEDIAKEGLEFNAFTEEVYT